jgi:S-adenosylmethionine synthetase
VNSCREWLRLNLPALDADRDLRIFSRLRPGSSELTQLFDSHKHVPLANDTVCGAGFAPLSDLEKTVLEVERSLNSPETKQIHPAIGADIKVMGVRLDDRIELTIGCALVSRFVRDLDDYIQQKGMVKTLALEVARRATPMLAEATVNGADDLDKGNIFLTVTGTSAEAGDDGEVGRGNRACGLITPYRPMTMEAVVGKNPVTHVGKLYNLMAGRLAATLANEIEDAANVECVLVNQIGRPVSDPHLVDIRLSFANRIQDRQYREQVSGIVQSELAKMDELRHSLLAGRVQLY